VEANNPFAGKNLGVIALFTFYDHTAFFAPVSHRTGFFSTHLIKIIAFLVMYLIAFRAEAVPQFCGCNC
jgi:hypothetical protein